MYFEDSKNNLIVEGKKINYEKEKDLIYSIGEAKIKLKNYDIKSENIFLIENLEIFIVIKKL